MQFKPLNITNKVPESLKGLTDVFEVKSLITPNWDNSSHKILFVNTHIDSEDLMNGTMLSTSRSKSTFENLVSLAKDIGGNSNKYKDTAICFTAFHLYKTYNLSSDNLQSAKNDGAKRVHALIKKLQPNVVVVTNHIDMFHVLELDEIENYSSSSTADVASLHGYPYKSTKYENLIYVSCLPYNIAFMTKLKTVEEGEDEDEKLIDRANLLGCNARFLATAFGRQPELNILPKGIYIDTIENWRKLFNKLCKEDKWSYDLETNGLFNYGIKMCMLSFAFDSSKGYVVTLEHKDTPFSTEEIKEIKLDLKRLFGSKSSAKKIIVGQNIGYDIRVTKNVLNLPYFYPRVWDIMGGEHALDENIKVLIEFGVQKPYNLSSICCRYGSTVYKTLDFEKSDSILISTSDITKKEIEYSALDAQVPIALMELQIQRACKQKIENISYEKKYFNYVVNVIGSMIKAQSSLNHRGAQLDRQVFFNLLQEDGPVKQRLTDIEKDFYNFDSVKKVNQMLAGKKGIPTMSMFDNTSSGNLFDLGTVAHKQKLFFDVLKLDPIKEGANGGSLNKDFQKAYKDIPEVALYSEHSKLKIIRDTYIEGWYRTLSEDSDGNKDFRLRASYGFTSVVTGRSNSYKPNLQNVPQHSSAAKFIKQLFVASPGCIKVDADYSAHEIRCPDLSMYVDTSNGKVQLEKLIDMKDSERPLVKSFNIINNSIEYKKIGYASKHPPTEEEDMLEIEYDGGKIQVTSKHRIWLYYAKRYVYADTLVKGDWITCLVGDIDVSCLLTKISKIEKPLLVGDIGVEDNHNLFISKHPNERFILIHNCWGLTSKDKVLIDSFKECLKYIYMFRANPSSETYKNMELLSDIHKVNYKNFTGTPVLEVTSEQRQSSKGIVFGSVYGMSIKSLSKQIDKPLKETQKLYDNFFATFKRGGDWLNNAIVFSEKNGYMYSPLGRRRNLSGIYNEDNYIQGAVSRQARNSPIQGMASDLGYMASDIYSKVVHEFIKYAKIISNTEWYASNNIEPTLFLKKKCYEPMGIDMMVHDSIKTEVRYDLSYISIRLQEYAMTTGVQSLASKLGLEFGVDLGIDFDVGGTGATMNGWSWNMNDVTIDYSYANKTDKDGNLITEKKIEGLRRLVYNAIKENIEHHKLDLDPKEEEKKAYKFYLQHLPYIKENYPVPFDKINK